MNIEALIGMNITQFLLGLVRASGLIVTAPLFQSRSIPAKAKALLAGALALTVAPYIHSDLDLEAFSFWMAVATLIQEMIVGLIMGLMVNLTMYALQLAGYFFDVPMGFGMINILDPQSGTEIPLLGQFNAILAGLIYLAVDGHLTLISSFIKSYDVIKPGSFFFHREATGVFLKAFSNMFYLGFKIGIPVVGTIFLADVALGIISKLIPQINVFVMGFSIKIVVGLTTLALFIQAYIFLIEQSFSSSGTTFRLLRMMLRHLTG